jgi:regulator of protease activity HflC (stomatin/prohibitin superfamily)
MVDEETRKVVSQKTLDEFWRPLNDKKNANAMSGIAQEIKDRLVPMMRSKGILLVVSRIVNFKFPHNGKDKMVGITEQQVATWGADWERKRTNKLADAKAIAEKDQQEARAYAEAQLLNSIAEALQKIHEINPQLPKQVIAMRYLNALQDYARENTPEEEEKIKELYNNSRTEQ